MKAPIIAGMRTRLTLQVPVDTPDDNGGVSRSYANQASLWAQIVPAAASDRFYAQQMQTTITHQVTLRYLASVTGQMRFAKGSRIFIIHAIEVLDERGRFMRCHCEEVRP